MNSALPFALFGLFAIGIVAAIVLRYVAEQRRREQLVQFCAQRGWEYAASVPDLAYRWAAQPFGQGDRRRVANVVRGSEAGRPFTAFDYSYETHTTDSKGNRSTTTHRFIVVAAQLPARLGMVEVMPDNAFLRLGATLGIGQDIHLESDDFNRRFRVRASDAKLASDVLHPRTMEFLLAASSQSWRIEGTDLLGWEKGTIDPVTLLRVLGVLNGVADGVPAFVWKDHGYDPLAGPSAGGAQL